jgi:hypothetical protein
MSLSVLNILTNIDVNVSFSTDRHCTQLQHRKQNPIKTIKRKKMKEERRRVKMNEQNLHS